MLSGPDNPAHPSRRLHHGVNRKHQEYWRKNLVITAILMLICRRPLSDWYARELTSHLRGFRLDYIRTQGSLIIYVGPRDLRALH